MRALLLLAGALLGCGAEPRFADRPVVWRVADADEVPDRPEKIPDLERVYDMRVYFTRAIPRALGLPRPPSAGDVNALDEVPDSTWFTNRIGVRPVSPAEAARGRSALGPPHGPFVVTGAKQGGEQVGFMARDRDGRRFLVKFDAPGFPDRETGPAVILNRIYWTLGYDVANDQVFSFARDELGLDPKAEIEDEDGHERTMTVADVDAVLAQADRRPDGRWRAIASEFLPGKNLGGAPSQGVRVDDPNDLVPHQHRRTLRALRVFNAWLNHTDMKEENTLDMYVEENGRHFVRHHLIDFTRVGTWGRWNGWETRFDWSVLFRELVTLGFNVRPWEDRQPSPYVSAGWYTPEPFDPLDWDANDPYPPFWEMDEADAWWAARLVARFDRPVLEAIVTEAQLGEPGAAAYFVDTLLARRQRILEAWLEGLSPLHDFVFEGESLCAWDLGVVYGTAAAGQVEVDDEARSDVARDGRVCVPAPGDGYQVLRLRSLRGEASRPVLEVHYTGDAPRRVLGLVRRSP